MRAVLAGIVTAASLAGCSGASDPEDSGGPRPPVATTEPTTTGLGMSGLRGSRHVPSWEWAVVMRDCLSEKGWEVSIPEDDPGAIDQQIPTAQEDAYTEDFVACSNEHNFSPDPPVIDAERAERAWEEYLRAASCMHEHGYEPPPPPSKEKFIAEQRAGASSWNPHRVGPDQEAMARSAIAACPISKDYILFGVRDPEK